MTASNQLRTATSAKRQLIAILTSFNRRQKTLDCLAALAASSGLNDVEFTAILVDDGSTDGTAEAVGKAFSWVRIEKGCGNLFWCRGMHRAFELAMQSDPDYLLWLNDDTLLEADALSRLLATEIDLRRQYGKPVIVVGSTVDPEKGLVSYGGELQNSRFRPMRFTKVVPSEVPQPCQSMNGNIVLIPRDVAWGVGNLDPVFEHAMGDTDYALRAGKQGIGVWVGPGVYGTCPGNPKTGTFSDARLSLRRRWQLIMSRKGLPWRSWLTLTRRHAGLLWPLYFGWPYLRLIATAWRRRV